MLKITYTAPNRSHHYPFAEALHKSGNLYAFVSGFSRLSPRSNLEIIGEKLKRHDFFQTLYIASIKLGTPSSFTAYLNHLSNTRLDKASYKWAQKSDVFMFYRTEGFHSMKKLHAENAPTVCVMEEVNSHVDVANSIIRNEFEQLGLKKKFERDEDYVLRLKTYEKADYIRCPSDFVLQSFISKGFPLSKLIKVPWGFPTIEISSNTETAKSDDTFRMLYVGQLHFRKGLRFAIEAFKKLKTAKKEFIIVGPKTPVTGLEKTDIPDGVVFTGSLKGEELKDQYRKANVFILPSLEEGLALVLGEALSFGLPILTTTNSGGSDFITDGIEGFIVPPSNQELLTEKLLEMEGNRGLLDKMSKACLNRAETLGGWDESSAKLVEELTKIVAAKKSL